MKAIYALYPNGQAAQQAVNRLRAAGVIDRDITVISSQPMEEHEFGQMDKATWMWWFACLGGVIGMGAALGLAWLAETSWEINVGGLPIFAWWPNLIIIFEMMMLGAILATVTTLVVSALLPRRGGRLYDPEVSDGQILVGVEDPGPDVVAVVQHALGAVPQGRVKTI